MRTSGAVTGGQVPTSNVRGAMGDLEKAVSELNELTDGTVTRCEMVLKPTPGAPSAEGRSEAEDSPLVCYLRSQTLRVTEISDKIRSMNDRIEL